VSFNIWTPHAVSSEARLWRASVWRIVEAQHVASTMKIVDNRVEQDLLETLLEANKPAVPAETLGLDYLLSTPFRYPSKRGGSRFRGPLDPGVFYGAESVHTASAELGYWRWKFLKDSPALMKLDPVAHTAFRTEVKTNMIDLRRPPFNRQASAWQHPNDYSATQVFARVVRATSNETTEFEAVSAILYESVRDPNPAWCAALLSPLAFAKPKPNSAVQTWWLTVNQREVNWRRDDESFSFNAYF
jgi:RES domain